MDPLNVREIGWALQGEDVLTRELEREAEEMLARLAADPSKLLGDDWQLSDADRAQLASTAMQGVMRDAIGEAFRTGVSGYVDDTLALTRPWGFDVREVRVPTQVSYGLSDVLAPRQHGEWLARNVPGAQAVINEHGGHTHDPELPH